MCGYYRELIRGYAKVIDPMQKVCKLDKPLVWGPDQQSSFEELKKYLTTEPVLALPTDEGRFYLDTDASDVAIGAVLQQEQKQSVGKLKLKTIAFGSRALNETERRYGVPKTELLAVAFFIDKFEAFLCRDDFTLRTDNSALKFLKTYRMDKNAIGRWIQKLEQFKFKVIHRMRHYNQHADALTKITQYMDLKEIMQCGEDQHIGVKFLSQEDWDKISVYTNIDTNGKTCKRTKGTQMSVANEPVNNNSNCNCACASNNPNCIKVSGSNSLNCIHQTGRNTSNCYAEIEVASTHVLYGDEERDELLDEIPNNNEIAIQVEEEHCEKHENMDDDQAWNELDEEIKIIQQSDFDKRGPKVAFPFYQDPFYPFYDVLQNCSIMMIHANPHIKLNRDQKRGLFVPHVVIENGIYAMDEELYHGIEIDTHPFVVPHARENKLSHQRYTQLQFVKAQRDDPIIRVLTHLINGEEIPNGLVDAQRLTDIKRYFALYRDKWFITNNGIVARSRTDAEKYKHPKNRLLIVPQRYQAIVLMHCHDGGHHRGQDKTIHQVRERFDWLHMNQDVIDWCESCPICQSAKSRETLKFPLKPIETNHPNELLQIDHLSLTKSESGHDGVLMVIDVHTKYAESYPVKDYTSKTVVKLLQDRWFARFGAPTAIQSDNGPAFASEEFRKFLQLSEVIELKGTAHHPASQGCVERLNRTLCQLLRTCADKQQDWDEWLPVALSAYNSTVHATTGFTPNLMMLSRETSTPLGYFFPLDDEEAEPSDLQEQVQKRIKRHAEILRIARHNIRQKQIRMKRIYDDKIRRIKPFAIGDRVLVKVGTRKVGETKKLKHKYFGPHSVVEVHGQGRGYTLSNGKMVHVERLRAYKGRPNDFELRESADDLIMEELPTYTESENEAIRCTNSEDWTASENWRESDAEDELLQDHHARDLYLPPDQRQDNREYRTRTQSGAGQYYEVPTQVEEGFDVTMQQSDSEEVAPEGNRDTETIADTTYVEQEQLQNDIADDNSIDIDATGETTIIDSETQADTEVVAEGQKLGTELIVADQIVDAEQTVATESAETEHPAFDVLSDTEDRAFVDSDADTIVNGNKSETELDVADVSPGQFESNPDCDISESVCTPHSGVSFATAIHGSEVQDDLTSISADAQNVGLEKAADTTFCAGGALVDYSDTQEDPGDSISVKQKLGKHVKPAKVDLTDAETLKNYPGKWAKQHFKDLDHQNGNDQAESDLELSDVNDSFWDNYGQEATDEDQTPETSQKKVKRKKKLNPRQENTKEEREQREQKIKKRRKKRNRINYITTDSDSNDSNTNGAQELKQMPFALSLNETETETVRKIVEIVNQERLKERKRPSWNKENLCYKFEQDTNKLPNWSKSIVNHDDDFLHSIYSKLIAATTDVKLRGTLQSEFRRTYGNKQFIRQQANDIGTCSLLGPRFSGNVDQYLFYAMTKCDDMHETNLLAWAMCLYDAIKKCKLLEITDVAISVIDPGLDGIPWKITYRLIDQICRDTGTIVHAYNHFYVSRLYYIRDKSFTPEIYDELDDKIFDIEHEKILPIDNEFVPYWETLS